MTVDVRLVGMVVTGVIDRRVLWCVCGVCDVLTGQDVVVVMLWWNDVRLLVVLSGLRRGVVAAPLLEMVGRGLAVRG